MKTSSRAASTSAAPEINDLGLLSSEAKILDALREIASIFGKTLSVRAMPENGEPTTGDYRFLIHFEQTQDAIAAAKAMKCYLCGFSTLLVTIPRQQPGAEVGRRPAV